jgi:CBS domain-containing protein
MQVSEILKVKGKALYTIAPEGRLTEAVSVMAQHNMGSLVVIDKGRMAGMLTFKEVLTAIDKGQGTLGDARVGKNHGTRSGMQACQSTTCAAP